jgi:ATP-dependent RNA helicase DeaD
VEDEPTPKAAPRATRVVPAEEAPTLPLEMQEAEELAARPKAEGFRHLGLCEQILADLVDVGYSDPTRIQEDAISIATASKDMIGQSQTGSGKTAAFVLPVLHRLYEIEGQGPAALILCPTRELARQVHAEFTRMSGKSGARAALIYGGVGMDDQFRALARHPHVVIGTPGRIIDHVRRRTLDLSRLSICVLDEADQMLDIGFLPDIEWVLKHTPPKRQMLLFSATMPDAIRKLASKHMHDPETVHVAPENVTVESVDQKYIAVDPDKKTALLAHFIETFKPEQMVVFCNTKHQTDRVAAVLKRKNITAHAIHSDLPQSKREKTLQDFRDGSLMCLIATNVAARGLDIPAVSHVVNYDIPINPEEYVHRVGRTGRMGREGIARTFVTPEDGQFVVEIEKHIGLMLDEEIVEGMLATTAKKAHRPIGDSTVKGPRLLKPISGGIRLGRRRR